MNPQIIYEVPTNVVDYSQQNFRKRYLLDGVVYYFAVFAELYDEEDGLENTGNMLVVLTHPRGMDTFILELQNDNWRASDEMQILIPQPILKMISDCICNRNM
jgi:hypothetical protein